MNMAQVGVISGSILPLVFAGQALAWGCIPAGGLIIEPDENSSITEKDIIRTRSKWYAERLRQAASGQDVVVFGKLFRNRPGVFLHELQVGGLRDMYDSPPSGVKLPWQLQYTYPEAYRFEGHIFENGTLRPFSVGGIDARVSISEDYEGIMDALPVTDTDVLGVLRSIRSGNRFELTLSPCPSYYQLDQDELADLLDCYAEGVCQ